MDDPCDPWFVPEPRSVWTSIKSFYQGWLPPLIALSSILWLSFVFFLRPARPPVGVYIACLAALAVVVTIWPPESNWSKAAWLAVFFALTGLEIATLYQERTENQKQQADARKAETDAFGSIAKGLTTSINNNQQAFEATMQKMRGLADLSSDAIKTATGGDSYCSMYFSYITTMRDGTVTGRVSIGNEGKYPLYGVLASLINIDDLTEIQRREGVSLDTLNAGKTDLVIGDLTTKPYGILWPTAVVLSRTEKPIRLVVRFSSTRGLPWVESVRIRKVGNEWITAIQLSREDPARGRQRIIRTIVPKNFPREGDENIWK